MKVLRTYLRALLPADGKTDAAVRMDIVWRVFHAAKWEGLGPVNKEGGPPANEGRLWPEDKTVFLTGGTVVNPWKSMTDTEGCRWSMCEFLRRLLRRGAITVADFPAWAHDAEVVEVRDRKRSRWVLRNMSTGCEVAAPTDGFRSTLKEIRARLGSGVVVPGPHWPPPSTAVHTIVSDSAADVGDHDAPVGRLCLLAHCGFVLFALCLKSAH